MQDLAGKIAFVTGGASGIGLGIAQALLGAGMKVAIADIRQDHLDQAMAELGGGEDVLAIKLDVTDREAFAAAADETVETFGKIHMLINNAGVAALGPVELAAYGDWDWTLGVCLGGTINGIVTVLPRILAHGEGGHIVSTASMSGMVPHAGAAVTDLARQNTGSFAHLFMTKEEVGERVLEGILADELFIMTHSEFLDGVKDRAAAMVAAVPHKRPENHEYKQTFARLFRNPVHAAEIARQEKLKA